MAYILKDSDENSKGIIVFTHKELDILRFLNRISPDVMIKIKMKFFIFVHWGHYHEVHKMPEFVDMNLAGTGTLVYKNDISVPKVNFCSRNFISSEFHPGEMKKRWDVINISRPLSLKKLDDFLLVIRKVFDEGIYPRVLLVCPYPPEVNSQFSANLPDLIKNLFNEEEQDYIDFLPLMPFKYPFQLSQNHISHLIQQSKSLAMFSHKEGESRVIAEALVCKVPVLARKNLIGGGLDYLNSENSMLFSSLEEAAQLLMKLTTGEKVYEFEVPEDLKEDVSLIKFEQMIRSFYASKKETFVGKLNSVDLSRCLASHTHFLPPEIRSEFSDDVGNYYKMYHFLKYIKVLTPDLKSEIKFKFANFAIKAYIKCLTLLRS